HGEACASLADYLPQWLAAGAKLIGGCCRTTPKDIAALNAKR
ncbi:homocysteine S-methyltransferase family protein, partial [Klebsiella pneumoniae subsp. pneumoniae]